MIAIRFCSRAKREKNNTQRKRNKAKPKENKEGHIKNKIQYNMKTC